MDQNIKNISYTKKIALRVSKVTIAGNFLLCLLKFIIGILSGSAALVSDGIHSASDVFSTFIVMIGFIISEKTEDKEHIYGHERFECVAAMILSAILFTAGLSIGKDGIESIIHTDGAVPSMGYIPELTAAISIFAKEIMYRYTKKAAYQINSPSLKADAYHHRSDALSSIGSFLGILGTKMGFLFCDGLASAVICIFILKAAIDIFKESVDRMVDKSCDEQTINSIMRSASEVEGVIAVDSLKTRLFGNRIYVDIEISADGNLNLKQAHSIAEKVHEKIELEYPGVKHCMVHVNPC